MESPTETTPEAPVLHALHQHLPSHHYYYSSDSTPTTTSTDDANPRLPFVATFAREKVQQIVQLAMGLSIPSNNSNNYSSSFMRDSQRLYNQLLTLETLKYPLHTETQLCPMVIHLLQLVTCVRVVPPTQEDDTSQPPAPKFMYEPNIAKLVPVQEYHKSTNKDDDEHIISLEQQQDLSFALPTPARETLLQILSLLLGNKGPLRSYSNASLFTTNNNNKRLLLVMNWQPFFRMLIRTAPYLEEGQSSHPTLDASGRTHHVLRRTVQLIRDARHYFDQGITANASSDILDTTSRQVWKMVRQDVLYHSHSHACYRGTILLYLFLPTRASSHFYQSVLPDWFEAWSNIDKCPEFDFLWIALLCRARKHLSPTHPMPGLRQRLLTHAQYWLHLPIGGTGMDKSFPRASLPRSRSCPPTLKAFVGQSMAEEASDFLSKVSKLLVAQLGTTNGENSSSTPVSTGISEGTADILRFWNYVTPYFHPSNVGNWSMTLGAFLHYFVSALCQRVGNEASIRYLQGENPTLVEELKRVHVGTATAVLPPQELVALLDALLPLCQQCLYSKVSYVASAGETAMLNLVQLDPKRSVPSFLEFAIRALDVGAVHMSHQAPAAISALTRLTQPALRGCLPYFLSRLPELLGLSLAGVDSNDQKKCIRTLIFYRNLASWIPVGGDPNNWPRLSDRPPNEPFTRSDGTRILGKDLYKVLSEIRNSGEYKKAVERLSPSSLLRFGEQELEADAETRKILLLEASSAMSDWALSMLERVYGLLRASGEREKTLRNSRVASRHTSADVQQARNFSRVLKECMLQVFASMDDDTLDLAIKSVVRFLQSETLPEAGKDASMLCQAVSALRCDKNGNLVSPGLKSLVPLLTDDLEHHSTKTVIYRLRCLAGAVRSSGSAMLEHKASISSALSFALESKDRHLFKTGCKLMRHVLTAMSESHIICSSNKPCVRKEGSDFLLGLPAELSSDPPVWYVPTTGCIEFSSELFAKHLKPQLDDLSYQTEGIKTPFAKLFVENDISALRRILRVARYCLRGAPGILLDSYDQLGDPLHAVPNESASLVLVKKSSPETQKELLALRGRLGTFLIAVSSLVSSDTIFPNGIKSLDDKDPRRMAVASLTSDLKVSKEVCDISLLLLTRRGAFFRSKETATIWRAQQHVLSDLALSSFAHKLESYQQAANLYGEGACFLMKDGEDGGKIMPRRLLNWKMQLFSDSLQRISSVEVPRRLRKLDVESGRTSRSLFPAEKDVSCLLDHLQGLLKQTGHHPLDIYEGICDNLNGLCCHYNAQVRAAAVGVVDYALTRFGFFVHSRVPRMLKALALEDGDLNGEYGLPSCKLLVDINDVQGKRKRLADAVKGICAILALSRSTKALLGTSELRLQFMETFLNSDRFVSLMPAEDSSKALIYLHTIFAPFRSKYFELSLPPSSASPGFEIVLSLLSESHPSVIDSEEIGGGVVHWRKRLLAGWFLLTMMTDSCLNQQPTEMVRRVWDIAMSLLQSETGQPLQKVALAIIGRLVSLSSAGLQLETVGRTMVANGFFGAFANALVYNHKEDRQESGGHGAQWSAGVEDVVRDTSRHIAQKSLFPFQRSGQSTGRFKTSHCQLVESLLVKSSKEVRTSMVLALFHESSSILQSAPSEDQKNQQTAAAEIYGGIARACILTMDSEEMDSAWENMLIPKLSEFVSKVPFSLAGLFFDALRYALQSCPADIFLPLTKWLYDKVKAIIWQPDGRESTIGPDDASAIEGFTTESKWLYIFSAIIIEVNDESVMGSHSLYENFLAADTDSPQVLTGDLSAGMVESWTIITDKMLRLLVSALGHPYDSCRDHIARCIFRICYSHRKLSRLVGRGDSEAVTSQLLGPKPGVLVVEALKSLSLRPEMSFIERCNALSTARRFIAYCIHLGESKFEFCEEVIPLLPLIFESLESKTSKDSDTGVPDDQNEDMTSIRAAEAEVIKSYRNLIADMGVSSVISYGEMKEIESILEAVKNASLSHVWQIRQAAVNYLRCFEGAHKFFLSDKQNGKVLDIVVDLLSDERPEVSTAATAAMSGLLSTFTPEVVDSFVDKYAKMASKSKLKNKPMDSNNDPIPTDSKELRRAKNQKSSINILCAVILSHPYDTPSFVPKAILAISKHSYSRNAPLSIRNVVKKCCAEYKRTHMSDNWQLHRQAFSQDQIEALEDVVSSPHYYA